MDSEGVLNFAFLLLVLIRFSDLLSVTTPGDGLYVSLARYGITVDNRTSLNFSAAGCGELRVKLQDQEYNGTKAAEYIIRENGNSRCPFVIHDRGKTYVKYNLSCSLDCNTVQLFWISWDNRTDPTEPWQTSFYHKQFWRIGRGNNISVDEFGIFGDMYDEFYPNFIFISSNIEQVHWEIDNVNTTAMESVTTDLSSSYDVTQTTPTTMATNVFTSSKTTFAETTTSQNHCYCANNCYYKNVTEEELNIIVAEIVTYLKVKVKDTMAYKRRLTSAPDSRPSARYVGGVGIIVLFSVVMAICLMDMPRVVHFIHNCCHRNSETNKYS